MAFSGANKPPPPPGYPWRMEAAEGTGFLLPRFWSQSVSCAKCGGELKHGTLEGFLLKDDLSPTVALWFFERGSTVDGRNLGCSTWGEKKLSRLWVNFPGFLPSTVCLETCCAKTGLNVLQQNSYWAHVSFLAFSVQSDGFLFIRQPFEWMHLALRGVCWQPAVWVMMLGGIKNRGVMAVLQRVTSQRKCTFPPSEIKVLMMLMGSCLLKAFWNTAIWMFGV